MNKNLCLCILNSIYIMYKLVFIILEAYHTYELALSLTEPTQGWLIENAMWH